MKYYGSPRWTGEILDCSMPMTFDTYNKCSFNCLYCFSYFQKSHTLKTNDDSGNYQSQSYLCWVDVEKTKNLFLNQGKIGKEGKQFLPYIQRKLVMQWGGLSDQFDNYERQHGITLELLKFFKSIDYPLSFSTKSCWFSKDERYMSLIRGQKNWHFKFSIVNLNKELAQKMEGGVESPEERLQSLKRISEAGVGGVTLRLRPFIIGYSDKNDDYLNLIRKAKECGADSVSTEFFCLERRADERLKERYRGMSRLIGFDLYEFYKKHTPNASGYLRLNRAIKEPYIKKMKVLCDELSLRFYVSDAHFKEYCNNGSCCGLCPKLNYSRGQFTQALVIAREKGKVQWKDIADQIDFMDFTWGEASGFNTGTVAKRIKQGDKNMKDFMRDKWNNPNDKQSPYKYFEGVLYPIGLDDQKNVVYEYRGDKNIKTI